MTQTLKSCLVQPPAVTPKLKRRGADESQSPCEPRDTPKKKKRNLQDSGVRALDIRDHKAVRRLRPQHAWESRPQ